MPPAFQLPFAVRQAMLIGCLFCFLRLPVFSQNFIEHLARPDNTDASSTTIDHPLANKHPEAILVIVDQWNLPPGIAQQLFVRYHHGRWHIVCPGGKPMPGNARFRILVQDLPNDLTFTHTTTAENTQTYVTTLDSEFLNARPHLDLAITRVSNQNQWENQSPVKPYYFNGRWHLFSRNGTEMGPRERFNVRVKETLKVKAAPSAKFTSGLPQR